MTQSETLRPSATGSAALRVGIAGLGTVGASVVRILQEQADLLADRAGRPVQLVAVAARDRAKVRGVSLDGVAWFDDAEALARSPDVDVVVELIGGSDGIARTVCETALRSGKHVVTANKALLAEHGTALASVAEENRQGLRYEAAVAGGIPIIKGLREGLAANRISAIHGILNGTCNYILSEMRETGRDFADILADAQRLGYAEADPSFDVDGVDTAHKLAILASLAFGAPVDIGAVHVEGIRHVSSLDIRYADELGYRIKLLGIARATDGGIEQRVHPCMIPASAPLASVEGVFNAIVAQGDFVGQVVMIGRGAGGGPTASAVVADIVDLAQGRAVPTFGAPVARMRSAAQVPMERRAGAYYVRLNVLDRPGVLADIAMALRDVGVSIEAFLQHGRSANDAVPVVLTTHDTDEASMRRALDSIQGMTTVVEPPRMIRVETL